VKALRCCRAFDRGLGPNPYAQAGTNCTQRRLRSFAGPRRRHHPGEACPAPAGIRRRDRPLIHPVDQRLKEIDSLQTDELRHRDRIRVVGRYQVESTPLSREPQTKSVEMEPAEMEHSTSGHWDPPHRQSSRPRMADLL
jgi:hypothetical protein